MKTYHVAIAGATGAVGTEFLRLLESREFPLESLRLLASERSAGRSLAFRGRAHPVEVLTEQSFRGVDIAFFSAGGSRSRQFAPPAVDAGALVIDNSSAFRMDPEVPLVIPEINAEDIRSHRGIIANPELLDDRLTHGDCPIAESRSHPPDHRLDLPGSERRGGAGDAGAARPDPRSPARPTDLAPGLPVPHCVQSLLAQYQDRRDGLQRGGAEDGLRVAQDPARPDLKIAATCVRVPVVRAHSESVNLEFAAGKRPSLEAVRQALSDFPGVAVVDDRERNHFPMPIEASGRDEVLVGRLRYDLSNDDAIELFLSGDQILKGAALNGIQIAEAWMRMAS